MLFRSVVPDGRFSDMLPDVIVRWNDAPANGVDGVVSPEHGEVRRPGTGSGRSGAHTPHAWALLVPASLSPVETERPHLVDVAATVCAALELEPDGLRGTPLLEA